MNLCLFFCTQYFNFRFCRFTCSDLFLSPKPYKAVVSPFFVCTAASSLSPRNWLCRYFTLIIVPSVLFSFFFFCSASFLFLFSHSILSLALNSLIICLEEVPENRYRKIEKAQYTRGVGELPPTPFTPFFRHPVSVFIVLISLDLSNM